MDRLFVFEEEYCTGMPDRDGVLLQIITVDFAKRNLDQVWECSLTYDPELKESLVFAKKNGLRIVPVGSIPFVKTFLQIEFGPNAVMPPIEVPDCLLPFLERKYERKKGKKIRGLDLDPDVSFIKDADTLKKFNSLLCLTPSQVAKHIEPDTNYIVSENVGFSSEWRCFVFRNEIRYIACYQGDPLAFPDSSSVQQMINCYTRVEHPEAYTLDIGVRKIVRSIAHDKNVKEVSSRTLTEPIEVHPFCSCGLYGFYDDFCIPDMLDKGYQWYRKQNISHNASLNGKTKV